jgi:hypothetical protein
MLRQEVICPLCLVRHPANRVMLKFIPILCVMIYVATIDKRKRWACTWEIVKSLSVLSTQILRMADKFLKSRSACCKILVLKNSAEHSVRKYSRQGFN